MWWASKKHSDEQPIVDLLRENNGLLRELIQALTSRPAQTTRSLPPNHRIRTDQDVLYTTTAERIQLHQQAQAQRDAPWRGPVPPASDATPTPPAPPSTAKTPPTPLL